MIKQNNSKEVIETFVKTVVAKLSEKEKIDLLKAWKDDDVFSLHHGFGMWIRNKYFYKKDKTLLNACYSELEKSGLFFLEDPDEASRILVEAVLKQLSKEKKSVKQKRV